MKPTLYELAADPKVRALAAKIPRLARGWQRVSKPLTSTFEERILAVLRSKP